MNELLNNPDISIVVPVYNVNKWLPRCINSLLKQKFSVLYELLLIDDGSTDSSGETCDAFQSLYNNVRTFHKKNGGLSDARNYGSLKARAEYITFVDSDDYVDELYLQNMWDAHIKYNADMVVAGVIKEKENQQIQKKFKTISERLYDSASAIEEMCYGNEITIFAYAKLYKKECLLRHLFPVGKIHEDIWTTYLLMDISTTIAAIPYCNYHYVQHENSILHQNFSIKYFNAIEGAEKLSEFVSKNYPNIYKAAVARLLIESNAILHRAINSEYYPDVVERVKSVLKNKWKIAITDSKTKLKIRLEMLIFHISPSIYKNSYKIFKRNI